jgi:hypothetical protein
LPRYGPNSFKISKASPLATNFPGEGDRRRRNLIERGNPAVEVVREKHTAAQNEPVIDLGIEI